MRSKNKKSFMHLNQQYKPQNQKSLFNQKSVCEIKKYIKELNGKDYKKILFVNGPSGCGKLTTIEVLFKNYNLIHIDADNIRFIENMSDVINGIASFNSQNLSQFEKKVSKSHIGNILILNNIQHCEKTLLQFLDTLYIKYNKNIPIILICNKQQIRQKFKSDFNTTFIEFSQPTYNELLELIKTINISHKLKLSDESIQKIIDTSMYDIHQVFHILEYLQLNKHPDFVQACTKQDTINDNISIITNLQKDHDIDLHNKMEYLFDFTKEFHFQKIDELTQADSSVISNTIFQNYIKLFNSSDDMIVLADISNSLCNDTNDQMFDSFDLHNQCDSVNYSSYYNILNCIDPLYKLYNRNPPKNKINKNKRNIQNAHDVQNEYSVNKEKINIENFKNYSYNNINSFDELKTWVFNSSNNICGNKEKTITFLHDNKEDLWILINTFIQVITDINKILETKKRNIKLEEHVEIIKKNQQAYTLVLFIVDKIWNYYLFETNENINKIKYNVDEIIVDIKIFKKYINIFSFGNNSKIIKISTENVIKYFLKEKVINLQNERISHNKISEIDKLTYDLSDIWTCMK